MAINLPTLSQAKAQAKLLRAKAESPVTHSRALEIVAFDLGFTDWNTLCAAISKAADQHFSSGSRLTGRYLGHAFLGAIVTSETSHPGWVKLVIDLNEAVDVVAFDSFSNFRSRIRGVIGPNGHSKEKTSDGTPHLVIDL